MVMGLPEGPGMVKPICLEHLWTRTDADLLVRRTVVGADEVVPGRLL